MSSLLDLIVPSSDIQNNVKRLFRHRIARRIYIAHSIICLLICLAPLLNSLGEEKNRFIFFFFITAILILYRLFLITSNKTSFSGFSPMQLICFDGGFQSEDLNFVFLELFSIILFVIEITHLQPFEKKDRVVYWDYMLYSEIACSISACENVFIVALFLILKTANIAYPETKYHLLKSANPGIAENCECTICKDTLSDDDMVKQLKCRHLFHTVCIDEWFGIKKSCPLCKQSIYEGESIRSILEH